MALLERRRRRRIIRVKLLVFFYGKFLLVKWMVKIWEHGSIVESFFSTQSFFLSPNFLVPRPPPPRYVGEYKIVSYGSLASVKWTRVIWAHGSMRRSGCTASGASGLLLSRPPWPGGGRLFWHALPFLGKFLAKLVGKI